MLKETRRNTWLVGGGGPARMVAHTTALRPRVVDAVCLSAGSPRTVREWSCPECGTVIARAAMAPDGSPLKAPTLPAACPVCGIAIARACSEAGGDRHGRP